MTIFRSLVFPRDTSLNTNSPFLILILMVRFLTKTTIWNMIKPLVSYKALCCLGKKMSIPSLFIVWTLYFKIAKCKEIFSIENNGFIYLCKGKITLNWMQLGLKISYFLPNWVFFNAFFGFFLHFIYML